MCCIEREKPKQYERIHYPKNQPNKPKASSSKNDGKVLFKKFVNEPWEDNMKYKEAQKDLNVILNTFPNASMSQITSYYYPICEMPHNPKQCGIYMNQIRKQEKEVQEKEYKVNCI